MQRLLELKKRINNVQLYAIKVIFVSFLTEIELLWKAVQERPAGEAAPPKRADATTQDDHEERLRVLEALVEQHQGQLLNLQDPPSQDADEAAELEKLEGATNAQTR